MKAEAAQVTGVGGLEARGFLLGPQVAIKLGLPFVPIRKAGKLPGPTVTAEYAKEYGKVRLSIGADGRGGRWRVQDVIAVQEGVIKAGDSILLVDDLLATGGRVSLVSRWTRDVDVCGCRDDGGGGGAGGQVRGPGGGGGGGDRAGRPQRARPPPGHPPPRLHHRLGSLSSFVIAAMEEGWDAVLVSP